MKKELKDEVIKNINKLENGLIIVANRDTGNIYKVIHKMSSAEVIGLLFTVMIDTKKIIEERKK